jgi:hypothetical protein
MADRNTGRVIDPLYNLRRLRRDCRDNASWMIEVIGGKWSGSAYFSPLMLTR